MTLAETKSGSKVRIIGFRHPGAGFIRRIQEMGILPGSTVEVERNIFSGPVELFVRGTHLAIGRGIAARILVEPLNE